VTAVCQSQIHAYDTDDKLIYIRP